MSLILLEHEIVALVSPSPICLWTKIFFIDTLTHHTHTHIYIYVYNFLNLCTAKDFVLYSLIISLMMICKSVCQ